MLILLATLLALIVVIGGVIFLVRTLIVRFGFGKRLRALADEQRLSEDVRQALDDAQKWRDEQRLSIQHELEKRPHLTREQRAKVRAARKIRRAEFLDQLHIGWYQIVLLFFVGSVLGLFLEETWMFVTAGLTQSRVGLVWGPFSPLYGVGATLLTIITFYMRRKHAKAWQVFLVAVVVGGSLEQFTGWSMSTFMHASSWDYSAVPGAITQWVAVPFLVFWGLLGLVWYLAIMPELLYIIGEPTTRRRVVIVSLLGAYLALDVFMTLSCFSRVTERHEGIPPQNGFQVWIDQNYTDEFMSDRFQNMSFSS